MCLLFSILNCLTCDGVLRLHALVALGVEEAGLGEGGVLGVEPGEDRAVAAVSNTQ